MQHFIAVLKKTKANSNSATVSPISPLQKFHPFLKRDRILTTLLKTPSYYRQLKAIEVD